MVGWLQSLFALVCGQRPEHTWMVAGVAMPVCQRCLGIYVGAALAIGAHLWWRPAWRTAARSWFAVATLQMVPMGLQWLPQGPVLRMASGLAFGGGAAALLWLPLQRHLPAPAAGPAARRSIGAMAAGAIASIGTAALGGTAARALLADIAAAGLAALVLLLAADAMLLAAAAVRAARGRTA